MRQYGRDTIGERPNDAADLPPEREELVEADEGRPTLDRLKNKLVRHLDDAVDASAQETDAVRNALSHPQPTGHAEAPVRSGPEASATDSPYHAGPSVDPIAHLVVVGSVMGYQAYNWIHHKIDELKRRDDAGHG